MMFMRSDLGRLREYVLIGNVACLVGPWPSTSSGGLEEWSGRLYIRPESDKLSLKYEINKNHEDIIITWKYETYYDNAK